MQQENYQEVFPKHCIIRHLGIGTSAFAIITYNIFTTKIDGITYGIDESGFTLTQSFASLYK